jgi:hypothetical protein
VKSGFNFFQFLNAENLLWTSKKSRTEVIWSKISGKGQKKNGTKSTYYSSIFLQLNEKKTNNKHNSTLFSYLVAISDVSNLITCALHVILYSHLTNPHVDNKQKSKLRELN